MADLTPAEQITKYLTDVHSIELQAIEQMKRAPRLAGDPDLARIFEEHLGESREHERLVREQLERRGAKPSPVKDVAGRVGGWGMVLFAKLNPDSPGKLAVHAFSCARRLPAGEGTLAAVVREHLEQTREHQRLLKARLEQLGSGPAKRARGSRAPGTRRSSRWSPSRSGRSSHRASTTSASDRRTRRSRWAGGLPASAGPAAARAADPASAGRGRRGGRGRGG